MIADVVEIAEFVPRVAALTKVLNTEIIVEMIVQKVKLVNGGESTILMTLDSVTIINPLPTIIGAHAAYQVIAIATMMILPAHAVGIMAQYHTAAFKVKYNA